MAFKVRGFEVAVNKETGELWDAKIPIRANKGSASYDFFAAEDVYIPSIWGPLLTRMFIKHIEPHNSESHETHAVYLRKTCKGWTKEKKDAVKLDVKSRFAPIVIHTGIKAYMGEDEVLCLYNRNSGPKNIGIILANGVEVVDGTYYCNEVNDGEVVFAYYNFFPFTIKIKKGAKIGQGIFQKILRADNDNLEPSNEEPEVYDGEFTPQNRLEKGLYTIGKEGSKFMSKLGSKLETAINVAGEQFQEGLAKVKEANEAKEQTQSGVFDLGERGNVDFGKQFTSPKFDNLGTPVEGIDSGLEDDGFEDIDEDWDEHEEQ